MKTYNYSRIHAFSFQKRTTVAESMVPMPTCPWMGPGTPFLLIWVAFPVFFVNLSVDFSYTFHLHFHMCFLLFSFLSVGLQGNIRKARPQRKQYSQIVVGAAMTRRRRLQYLAYPLPQLLTQTIGIAV